MIKVEKKKKNMLAALKKWIYYIIIYLSYISSVSSSKASIPNSIIS